MKNNKKLIVGLALFAALLIAAALLYPSLSAQYLQENRPEAEDTKNQEEEKRILAPDFTVYDAEGNEVSLSDFIGKPIVLNFWASWCPPCKAEMPDFQDVYTSLKSDTVFLMINMTDGQRETLANAQSYLQKQGFTFPVFFDTEGEAASEYGISSIPTTIFIDREGYAVLGYQGAINRNTLLSGIEAITD